MGINYGISRYTDFRLLRERCKIQEFDKETNLPKPPNASYVWMPSNR